MERILFVDDEQFVLDGFKRLLREFHDQWQLEFAINGNEALEIVKEKDSVKVTSLGKSYVFPFNDCVFLPTNSTSAENLSKYILERLVKEVKFPKNVESIEIGVDEGYGQGARVSKNF